MGVGTVMGIGEAACFTWTKGIVIGVEEGGNGSGFKGIEGIAGFGFVLAVGEFWGAEDFYSK